MNYINKFEEINVDINLIFKLINNVENYHKFLPWCSGSQVLTDVNDTMLAEIEISKNFINWKFKTAISLLASLRTYTYAALNSFNSQINRTIKDNRIFFIRLYRLFSVTF